MRFADRSSPAPSFELATHDGTVWRLEAHRGKPVVLIFHRHIH